MQQTIKIRELTKAVHLGWSVEERSYPRIVSIDLNLHFDAARAVKSDQLEDTIDYVEVIELIDNLTKIEKWKLLEKMCFDIVAAIFSRFLLVDTLSIFITKNILPNTNGITTELTLTRKEWETSRG